MQNITQKDIVIEYFKNNQKRNIAHPEIVDWIVAEYLKRTNKVFRDPDRQIRQLHQSGFLIKIAKGIYKYDPDFIVKKELEDFSEQQKQQILQRDGYRCVICGKGKQDGIELQIDHIKSKDKGGKAVIENGQVLCATHNFRKKNYQQTETGKKMFIRLYEAAKAIKDSDTMKFCADILEVFEQNNVNGHIEWKR